MLEGLLPAGKLTPLMRTMLLLYAVYAFSNMAFRCAASWLLLLKATVYIVIAHVFLVAVGGNWCMDRGTSLLDPLWNLRRCVLWNKILPFSPLLILFYSKNRLRIIHEFLTHKIRFILWEYFHPSLNLSIPVVRYHLNLCSLRIK